MPEIKTTTQTTAFYDVEALKELIVADFNAKPNLPAINASHVSVVIEGGHLDRSWDEWGGPRVGTPEVIPAKLVGFRVVFTQ